MRDFNLTMPVIGILRGVEAAFFRQIVLESHEAGLQAIEVAMNTVGGLKMVEECRPLLGEGQLLGMGTICTVQEAGEAIDAGAMFLVTPSFSADVIEYAKVRSVPVVAGALTPTEIYDAWKSGAAMVKVFPCQAMGGPAYIKDLRGPFDDIPLVAVGGVTFSNLKEYFSAGTQAVGVSTALFGKQALVEKDLRALTASIEKFCAAVGRLQKAFVKGDF